MDDSSRIFSIKITEICSILFQLCCSNCMTWHGMMCTFIGTCETLIDTLCIKLFLVGFSSHFCINANSFVIHILAVFKTVYPQQCRGIVQTRLSFSRFFSSSCLCSRQLINESVSKTCDHCHFLHRNLDIFGII